MDHVPQQNTPFLIDETVQKTLTGELLAIMRADWESICMVDRLAKSFDDVRLHCGWEMPELARHPRRPRQQTLHLDISKADSTAPPNALPTALLSVFGLDDISGPMILGEHGWREVEDHLTRCAGAAARIVADVASSAASEARHHDRRSWVEPLMRLSMHSAACLRKTARRVRMVVGTWIIGELDEEIAFTPRSSPGHAAVANAYADSDRPPANFMDGHAQDPVEPIKQLLSAYIRRRQFRPISASSPEHKQMDKRDIEGFVDDDDDDDALN